MVSRERLLFLLLIALLFVVLHFQSQIASKPDHLSVLSSEAPVNRTGKRWIVITSIQYPSEQVKKLAAQTNWTVVIVADTKTPPDWNYPNVHFLSLEKQKEFSLTNLLPTQSYTRKNIGYLYAIKHGAEWIYDTDDDHMPFGKLFSCHFQCIFPDKGLDQFDYIPTVSGLRYVSEVRSTTSWLDWFKNSSKSIRLLPERLFNPYRFYGFKNMWPRGFPLEHLKNHTNGLERYQLCRETKSAAVQQGIVHSDPDVDAVYRLVHADQSHGLETTFNRIAPAVILDRGSLMKIGKWVHEILGAGQILARTVSATGFTSLVGGTVREAAKFYSETYAPWNSQNTLFHYRAFFILFLPTTVEFRVTDIWRSYFGQKLLHLIGENVAFYPVNAVQQKNPHSYFSDFHQEIDVYEKSGKMIEVLDAWKCSSTSIANCTLELAEHFVTRGFWLQKDAQLVIEWIKALKELKYKFPKMVAVPEKAPNGKFSNCRWANLDLGTRECERSGVELCKRPENLFGELIDWCNAAGNNLSANSFPSPNNVEKLHKSNKNLQARKNSVLILINNYPWKTSIGLLQRLYSSYFSATIFCGTWSRENVDEADLKVLEPINFIHVTEEEMNRGEQYSYCVSKVRDMRLQNVEGYHFVADDTVFHFWKNIPTGVVVHGFNRTAIDNAWYNAEANRKVLQLLNGKYADNEQMMKSWKMYKEGLISYANNPESAEDHILKNTGQTLSDFFYVPSKQLDYFADMNEVFSEAGVMVEQSQRKLLHTVEYKNLNRMLYMYGNEERAIWTTFYNNPNITAFHPIKMSGTQMNMEERRKFCSTVIANFQKNLFS